MRSTLSATILMLLCGQAAAQGPQMYGFEGGLAVSVATGNSASFYNTGLGLRAGTFYDIEPNIRLAFVLGYYRYTLDEEAITEQYRLQGGTGTVQVDGRMSALPLLVSVRLISPPRGFRFYGDLEVGIYTYWTRASGSIVDGATVTPVPERTEFRSEPGGSLGVGFLIAVQEAWSLDAGVRYTFVRDSEYASYTGSGTSVSVTTSQTLTLALGLNYAIPL